MKLTDEMRESLAKTLFENGPDEMVYGHNWTRFAEVVWEAVDQLRAAYGLPGELAQRGANAHAALEALHTWLHSDQSGDANLIEACNRWHGDQSEHLCRRAHEIAIEQGTLPEGTPFTS